MDNNRVLEVKAQLDDDLTKAGTNVGIAFGFTLFQEFAKREWFTNERFGVHGTEFLGLDVPAYQKTHFAFPRWDLAEQEYLVGHTESA